MTGLGHQRSCRRSNFLRAQSAGVASVGEHAVDAEFEMREVLLDRIALRIECDASQGDRGSPAGR
jgi:hypothetical protein